MSTYMKKGTRVLAAILVTVLLTALTACSQSRPADILPKLESAINKYDVNAILNCYDPSVKQALGGLAGFLGSAVGFSGSSIMDLLPFLSQLVGQKTKQEFGSIKVKLTELSTTVAGIDATMQVKVSVTYDGREESEIMTLKLVQVNGQWYLSAEDMQNAILDGIFN